MNETRPINEGNDTRRAIDESALRDEGLDGAVCCANPQKSERQIITDAHRKRLNHGLRTMASWCMSRARMEHDTETTLTMLEKKAAELRGKVMKAGWAAITEHSQHNAHPTNP